MILELFIFILCLVSAALTVVLLTSFFPTAKEVITRLFSQLIS